MGFSRRFEYADYALHAVCYSVFWSGSEIPFENVVPDTKICMQDFLKKCDDRKALFDNKTKDKAKRINQTNDLLRVIDDMLLKNGGSPYSNELFKEAQVFLPSWIF